MFCKVTQNTKLANTKPELLLGKYTVGFNKLLVTSFQLISAKPVLYSSV